jgi:hypothetical protein
VEPSRSNVRCDTTGCNCEAISLIAAAVPQVENSPNQQPLANSQQPIAVLALTQLLAVNCS